MLREAELDILMSQLAGGDRAAFADLYGALQPRALRVAKLRVGDGEAADVAQSALERVFARASDFTPGRACLPWFYAIVANEVQTSRRRAARVVLDPAAGVALPSLEGDAETQLLERELSQALEAAVEELDADAAGAIAALLGRTPPPDVKPATFRKRLSRAYVKLRLLLGGDHGS